MPKKTIYPALNFTITDKTRNNLDKLVDILKESTRLLIVLQDNPDPDSIAAAVGLRKLANTVGQTRCSLTHGGTIGRGENRALVTYLDLNLHLCTAIEFDKFSTTALLDTQPATGNNSLPDDIVPNIVIDHHWLKESTRSSKFHDVRPHYGATSTIILEYLAAAGITPDAPLATALLYAIRSDTQDLGREACSHDVQSVAYLFPLANKRMLGEIQRGSVPREYYQMLAGAIQNAQLYGNAIVAHLSEVSNPDMIAEVADLLLREENTSWTMCTGFYNDKMLLSVRTCDEKNRADLVAKHIVARKGTGGGHQTYAGGQVPLINQTDKAKKQLEKTIQYRFLKAVGCDSEIGSNLINK